MSVKDITTLLGSVGFSSPPSWRNPYRVLSTGEQFRADIARSLAELSDLAVIDEFTSVIDRQVARIGSTAVSKAVRRRKQKLIAVTCHYDIEEWLDPDWVYSPADGTFLWRSLQGRPKVAIEIARVHRSAWQLFAPHHYLTAEISNSATCFCAFLDGQPVSFQSYLPFVGRLKDKRHARRGHRNVTLPDFQGLGIGNTLATECAAMWKGLRERTFRNTAHPGLIAVSHRSPAWRMLTGPSLRSADSGNSAKHASSKRSTTRMLGTFEYVGPAMDAAEARLLRGPVGA